MRSVSIPFKVACIQNRAGADPGKNLKKIRRLVRKALVGKPALIALPENFYWRGDKKNLPEVARKATPEILKEFQAAAKENEVFFLLGSVVESSPVRGKFYNTSVLISPSGKISARYRKIHLFDVALRGRVSVRESRSTQPGNRVITARIGKIQAGLAICYDLRFPELFRRLARRGARMIFLPANFTQVTGRAHWEVLIRARAIENQVFMIAPAQTGTHPATGIASFGNSLIIDPWGRILARGSRGREEVITAVLDLRAQERLRREFPVLTHIRIS